MYLELYIYFTNNHIVLFTLDDPDKDIHTQNLIYYNLILLKPKCNENDIYLTADKIKKYFNIIQVPNDTNYNILHYHQMITLSCNENLIYEFLDKVKNFN